MKRFLKQSKIKKNNQKQNKHVLLFKLRFIKWNKIPKMLINLIWFQLIPKSNRNSFHFKYYRTIQVRPSIEIFAFKCLDKYKIFTRRS